MAITSADDALTVINNTTLLLLPASSDPVLFRAEEVSSLPLSSGHGSTMEFPADRLCFQIFLSS